MHLVPHLGAVHKQRCYKIEVLTPSLPLLYFPWYGVYNLYTMGLGYSIVHVWHGITKHEKCSTLELPRVNFYKAQ